MKRAAPVALLVLAGMTLAWRRRFVCDDAFISFAYARALAEGHGLTWFGTRVEGYTNFLWVLWSALGARFGAEPIAWSQAGGLAAFAAAGIGTWRLATHAFASAVPRFAVLVIWLTNATVLAFATSGLETMLQAALLVHATVAALDLRAAPGSTRSWIGLGGLLGAAVLARIDSLLPAAILIAAALGVRHGVRRAPALGALGLAFGLPVAAWFAWKLAYYGAVLPNTFHAKGDVSASMLANGARYVARWGHAYALWPVLGAGLLAALVRRPAPRRMPAAIALPAALAAAWIAYLVVAGGDFMEFRMLVPIAPQVAVLLVAAAWYGIGALVHARTIATALACTGLVLASILHARRFTGVTPDRCLDSVPALADFYGVYEDGDWSAIGRPLGAALAGSDAHLALHAVGAIPYYARLRTLDMYGLNDREIARHGTRAGANYARPGHRRQASLARLRERRVHLVLGHPTRVRRTDFTDPRLAAERAAWVRGCLGPSREPVADATLVAMPLPSGGFLQMWYLTPLPAIDAAIRDQGWLVERVFTVR